jgi:ribosomal protein S10
VHICSQHSIHMSCPMQLPKYRNSVSLLRSISVH